MLKKAEFARDYAPRLGSGCTVPRGDAYFPERHVDIYIFLIRVNSEWPCGGGFGTLNFPNNTSGKLQIPCSGGPATAAPLRWQRHYQALIRLSFSYQRELPYDNRSEASLQQLPITKMVKIRTR
jgi:hypothetical protein